MVVVVVEEEVVVVGVVVGVVLVVGSSISSRQCNSNYIGSSSFYIGSSFSKST